MTRPDIPGLRVDLPRERPAERTRPVDRQRSDRSRPLATDRPVFRPYDGSLERDRTADREGLSPNRRRLIEIEHHDEPKGSSPVANHGVTAPRRSDHVRGSKSRGHHSHRHHHHYGCGHYGYGSHRYYSPYYGYYSPYYGYSPYAYYPPYYRGHRYYGDFGDRYDTDVHITVEGDSGTRHGGALGALDVDVEPQRAEIFVDGYLVGEADQFDGYPNYLWLDEGTYELAFYLEGYETVFRQYTIYPGVIIDIDDKLRPGQAIRPQPAAGYPSAPGAGPGNEPDPGSQPLDPATDPSIGRIAIVGSPADAAVYLDGHFVGTAGEIAELSAGLIVEPGDHVVELVRPGYSTKRLSISVPAGEQVDLNLSLREQ